MAKKTVRKKAASGKKAALTLSPAVRRARALRKTSFGPILRAIAKTEGHIRKLGKADADEQAKDRALVFLDAKRKEFSTKCVPLDDDEDFKNIPFSLAKRNK